MTTSAIVVDKVRQLTAAGQHAEVVNYLAARQGSELVESASLALLYGTAQARLGRHAEGLRWLDTALEQARKGGERGVESRALNARGAMSLVSGRIDEAADYCTRALMLASLDGDLATVGRCSNNLGIISNLRGRRAEAIGSWEVARAAFDRGGWRQGVAECGHNLGIAYREQGALDRALAEADRAVAEAEATGDRALWALVLRGRAETHIVRGELEPARGELEQIRESRSQLPHPADEAEDARVVASLLTAEGRWAVAEGTLRVVIERAEAHQRPLLQAEASRDLSMVLRAMGRQAAAQTAALAAKAIFTRLGAEGELRNLARQGWNEDFTAELQGALAPLHAAQELADAGHYATLVTYLGERSQDEVEQSPMLALLCGIGHARLGRLDVGHQWAQIALSRARVVGDRMLELRALNVCGAIALEQGGISEATDFFTRAQDEAVRESERLRDLQLKAQALAGRAEIQIARREPGLAIREAQRAVVMHRDLKDAVRETEDLRILAVALCMTGGSTQEGEGMLREVIARAAKHERPLLVALAQRDLAQVLSRGGDVTAAKELAQTARAALKQLGAKVEIAKLDAWLQERTVQRTLPPPGILQAPSLNPPPPGP